MVRDQEVGGSNPLAPTNPFNNLQAMNGRNAHPFAHPLRELLPWTCGSHTAAMARSAAKPLVFPSADTEKRNSSGPVLVPVIDIDVRHIGRKTTQAFPGIHAPEGWVKKEDRQREGKVWIGYFHLWTEDHTGRRVRTKKEKKLGPGTMPKHQAQQKLADYIEEYTGKLIHQGESIETFADLWKAFSAVKAGSWGNKMREDLKYLFN